MDLRVPPHDDMAERATISALLLNNDVVDEIITYLRPHDFYQPAHGLVYEAILNLRSRGEGADVVSVQAELKKTDNFEKAGGLQKLNELANEVSSSANVEYYAKIVQAASIRRLLMQVGSQMAEFASDETREVRNIVEEVEKRIFELSESNYRKGFIQLGSIYGDVLTQLAEMKNRGADTLSGISTGFVDLDRMLGGFHTSEYILIGARPSIGKTALSLQIALNMAIKNNIRVGFFSLEMPSADLLKRLIAQHTGISASKLRNPQFLSSGDLQTLKQAAGDFYSAPIYVNDTANMRLLDLKTEARKMKRKHDVQVIFVDYIGLIEGENSRAARHEAVSDISRAMKSLARELEIPVVCLSQVGRSAENKVPSLAELRDSGSLEQDADVVLFLHRDRMDQGEGDYQTPEEDGYESRRESNVEIVIAKQRNGPVGSVYLYFEPSRTSFSDAIRTNQY